MNIGSLHDNKYIVIKRKYRIVINNYFQLYRYIMFVQGFIKEKEKLHRKWIKMISNNCYLQVEDSGKMLYLLRLGLHFLT